MRREPRPAVPSDTEMRERAINLLKRTMLFRNVSRRVLADLVDRHGLTRVGSHQHDVLGDAEPAVLVVLEGTLEVRRAGPEASSPLVLRPGVYLRGDRPLIGIERLHVLAAKETVRVFLLDRVQFGALPRIVVNALDAGELSRMELAGAP